MINFLQFLNEVFDNPRPYTIDYVGGRGQEASFKTADGKVKYLVSVAKEDDGRGFQHEILFSNEGKDEYDLNVSMRRDNKYQVEVMATVVKIVKDYFAKHPLRPNDIIRFSSTNSESGKIKIYRRLMKMIAKEVGGKFDEDNLGHETYFMVFKK